MRTSEPAAWALVAFLVCAGGMAAIAGVAGRAVIAQEPAKDAGQPRPTFRAGTNYVRVDVYPTLDGRILDGLKAEDFELREDGVVQKLDRVEFVDPGPAIPDAARVEPNSVQQSLDAAADPRARLFVIFIDTYHLHWTSGYRAYLAFADVLGRQIGERDLVAIMTPEMSAASITFGRRTAAIEEVLRRHFDITRSGTGVNLDEDDNWYLACYGNTEVARKMIERRHEKLTLDALRDLARFLGALRDERKAVFMVSDGWAPTRPDQDLAKVREDGRPPTPPKVGTGPDGRIRTGIGDPKQQGGSNQYSCDQDRMRLAREDHESEFRQMLDVANRSSVSFYSLDLRGLTVQVPPGRDLLLNMSSATDGYAIVETNDLSGGVRRAMADMSGYYLLGYYPSNAKADGRFRSIKISVKRPRVKIRARRGYLAPSEAELNSLTPEGRARGAASGRPPASSAAPVASTPVPAPSPFADALDLLTRIKAGAAVHTLAGVTWSVTPDGAPRAAVWIAGEFDAITAARDQRWEDGAEVAIGLTGPDGAPLETVREALDREKRFFLRQFGGSSRLAAGSYSVGVTTRPAGSTVGTTETLQVIVTTPNDGGPAAVGQPITFRRGPYSGPDWAPTGDLRFHRQERVKVETAVTGEMTAGTVRLLDRSGRPLPLPVNSGLRVEAGVTIVYGEVALAPLGMGEYLIETTVTRGGKTETRLTAIRVVP